MKAELLAPAGDQASLRAAIDAGADAVYFGLTEFSARARAENFSLEVLPRVMDELRSRSMRGYVAMNTLVFPCELERAAELLRACAEAGADALIVQDLGLARLARKLVPDLPIHASTQMCLSEAGGIELASRLADVKRVILPRELSLEQIQALAKAVKVELEVFVHGALCLSYGGQCLASASLGGRSANRGRCAQPCRLPYVLSEKENPIRKERPFPLSPLDLFAWELLPALLKAGVRCFKIEGRLKGARYVSTAVGFYRRALDAAIEGKQFFPTERELAILDQGFSRGFTRGFLGGAGHDELVEGVNPAKRGVRVGVVTGATQRGVLARLETEVKPGDGLCFEANAGQEDQGGRVYQVAPHKGDVFELRFAKGAVEPHGISRGAVVFRTDDPSLNIAPAAISRPSIPLAVHVQAVLGGPLQLSITDESGNQAVVSWPGPLQSAQKHPLTEAQVRDQVGRLGGTPFELGRVFLDVKDPVMVPKSVLNDLRRQAVDKLLALRRAKARRPVFDPQALETLLKEASSSPKQEPCSVHVLVRHAEQLPPILTWLRERHLARPSLVYLDFPDLAQVRASAQVVRAGGMRWGLATPRVIEPGEEQWLQDALALAPEAVLVRGMASAAFCEGKGVDLIGDQGLNTANELSTTTLLGLGFSRLTPAYELAGEELSRLVRAMPDKLELPLFRRAELFHTKHCLFSANLEGGPSCDECPKPCKEAELSLKDRKGEKHVVRKSALGRCSVFRTKPETLSPTDLQRWGVRHFRVELLDETPEEAKQVLERLGSLK